MPLSELELVLQEAFDRIYPQLERNPAELYRRLLRRRLPTFLRPPRATCLCLRADDTRLDESFPHGFYPDVLKLRPTPLQTARRRALRLGKIPNHQTLQITHAHLARLSEPVQFRGPMTVFQAAELLGVTSRAIRKRSAVHPHLAPNPSRILFKTLDGRGELGIMPHNKLEVARAHAKGIYDLDSHEAKTLARGKYHVLVIPYPNRYRLFDPTTRRLGALPDPLHGPLFKHNIDHLPYDFSQTITRFRLLQHSRWPRRCDAVNHLTIDADNRQQNGWLFRCPQCDHTARQLFIPVPLFTFPDYLGLHPETSELHDRLHHPLTLACYRCHNVDFTRSSNTKNSWSKFITQTTAGLLFGHEVPRPPSLQNLPTAKSPHPKTPRKSPCRDELISRKLSGESWEQIAQAMHLKITSVKCIWYQHKPPNAPSATLIPTPY